MIELSDIPTLIAEPVEGYELIQWRVWCRYCDAFHYHGAVAGHRWAHCSKGSSPYNKTGYIIAAPILKASLTTMKAV